ncbi:MAG: acetyl-CoA C-acyltransferase [Alphaproteobacteria bacterium]|nr:acetyl-CoA C-acyltransferase [Alphaproteobacteria bacterium]
MATQEAYIVGGFRTAVTKSKKGGFRFMRSDELSVQLLKKILAEFPQLDPKEIDDLIVGTAVPEAEQGMQYARFIASAALGVQVPGITINRYCASGAESIAIATSKIRSGMADCIIAGGAESMSLIPISGWKPSPAHSIFEQDPSIYFMNMGLTAENVAKKFNVSRAEQDEFALKSHLKAAEAIQKGYFKSGIMPITVKKTFVDDHENLKTQDAIVDTDEGVRADSTLDALAKLKPVFALNGTVTAGNSSQTSDGAAFVIVMSEKMITRLNLKPIARLIDSLCVGVPAPIMGIGPVDAISKILTRNNMNRADIDLIELNEAFASQSVAVIKEAQLDPDKVNINGGAIALGHPLGCTGAKLTIQLIHDLKRLNKKFGIVTACVGGGQGIASLYEKIA